LIKLMSQAREVRRLIEGSSTPTPTRNRRPRHGPPGQHFARNRHATPRNSMSNMLSPGTAACETPFGPKPH
jgi:hypothetical protein